MSINNGTDKTRAMFAMTAGVKRTEFGTIVVTNNNLYVEGETQGNKFISRSYPKATCCEDKFTILNSYDFPYEYTKADTNNLIVRGVRSVPEYGNSTRYIEKEESITGKGAEMLIDTILKNGGMLSYAQNITDAAPPIDTKANNELRISTSPYEMFSANDISEIFNDKTLARINKAIIDSAGSEDEDMFVSLGTGDTYKSPCVVFVENSGPEITYFVQTIAFFYKNGAVVAKRNLNFKLSYHIFADGEFMSGNEVPVVPVTEGYTIVDTDGAEYSAENIKSLTELKPMDDGRPYQIFICGEKFVVDFVDDNTMQSINGYILDFNCAVWVKRCTTFEVDDLLCKLADNIAYIVENGEENDMLLTTDGLDEKVVALVDAISQRIQAPSLNKLEDVPTIEEYKELKAEEVAEKINSIFSTKIEFAL